MKRIRTADKGRGRRPLLEELTGNKQVSYLGVGHVVPLDGPTRQKDRKSLAEGTLGTFFGPCRFD